MGEGFLLLRCSETEGGCASFADVPRCTPEAGHADNARFRADVSPRTCSGWFRLAFTTWGCDRKVAVPHRYKARSEVVVPHWYIGIAHAETPNTRPRRRPTNRQAS